MLIALPARRRRRGDPGVFDHRVAGYPCITSHCLLRESPECHIRDVRDEEGLGRCLIGGARWG